MNFEQIEAINAIVDHGSFRAAAEVLHKSQPALSASIKNLEAEFNVEIFDRSTYRPRLTEAGQALITASQKVLESARYFARVGKELGHQQIETRLRVSIDPLTPLEAIELITLECARPTFPVALVFSKAILNVGADNLLAGEADLAFGKCPEDSSEIESLHIRNVVLVGAVARELLGYYPTPNEEFLNKNAQILVFDKEIKEPAAESSPQSTLDRSGQKIFAPDHFTKLRMISAGLGWGRVSQEEFSEHGEFVQISETLCQPLQIDLCLMRPKNRPLGPIARAIWSAFEAKYSVKTGAEAEFENRL